MSRRDRLREWNGLAVEAAAEAILPCNGSRAWADGIAARRPYASADELSAAADGVWDSLEVRNWQEAFDSHPRIGQQHAAAATNQSLLWSQGEQAAASADETARAALRSANRAYEARFGRIFIVCATGKTAAEMLALLQQRMLNDAATELRVAAEEQRRITQIRLRKWLGVEAPSATEAPKGAG